MRIDILSLFPAMFAGPFGDSITKRAVANGILDIHLMNPRDFALGRHKQVDDSPFGGGSGMVLKPEPMFKAVNFIKDTTDYANRRVLLMSPEGAVFNQAKARELAQYDQLILSAVIMRALMPESVRIWRMRLSPLVILSLPGESCQL